MAYLGKTPSQAVRSRYYFTASGSETSLSPTEVTGLSFTDANYVDVSLNGVALVSGTDYTATPSTNTISGLAALTASDVVEIVVYDTFSVFGGNVNGDFNISGGDLTLGDDDKAIFGDGSDLQIYHNGSGSFIDDAGTGNLFIRANDFRVGKYTGEFYLKGDSDGAVELYYDNSKKLETTATGIDVTGTVTADGLTVDTDTLHVDATNNRVGIGTSSPVTALEIQTTNKLGSTFTGTTNGEGLTVTQSDYTAGNYVSLVEAAYDDSGDASPNVRIGAMFNSGGSNLAFGTSNSYGSGITNTAMFIDINGNVGIGTTSPNAPLDTVSNVNAVAMRVRARSTDEFGLIEFVENDGSTAHAYIGTPAADTLAFYSNGFNERMRIDSSGKVGIGTSSPSGGVQVDVRGSGVLQLVSTDVVQLIAGNGGSTFKNVSNSPLIFGTNNTERARISNTGQVFLSKTSAGDYTSGFEWQGNNGALVLYRNSGVTMLVGRNDNGEAIRFNRGTSDVGSIDVTASATSYNTSSDYRLKENVADLTGAITRVKALAPKRFNFIVDPDTTVDGFLAHEAQTVVPEAVTGTHNETRAVTNAVLASDGGLLAENVTQADWTAGKLPTTDEDGNAVAAIYPSDSTWSASHTEPVMQGIDQSKLVPLLTGALQEAIAKIESLETRIAALEA